MRLKKFSFYIVCLFLLIPSVYGTDEEPDSKMNERKSYYSNGLANNKIKTNEEMQKIDIVK